MNRMEIFDKVLEKFKFKESVPETVKKFALWNKPRSLTATLKLQGEYSFYYNYVIKIYYFFGKYGISVSIVQSKIILSVFALFLCASISAGATISYKYISDVLKNAESIVVPIGLPNKNEELEKEPPSDMPKTEIIRKKTIKPAEKTNPTPSNVLKEYKKESFPEQSGKEKKKNNPLSDIPSL